MRKSQRRKVYFRDGYSRFKSKGNSGNNIYWNGEIVDIHCKNYWFAPKSKVFTKHKLGRGLIVYDNDRRVTI